VNTNDILRTLHGLAVEDRAWILARLPARAKGRLLDVPAPQVAQSDDELPRDIDAARLAAVLAEEPSWIAAAVRGEAEPARSKFQSLLARLSAARTRKRLTIHL
jgi:hypothetical protein